MSDETQKTAVKFLVDKYMSQNGLLFADDVLEAKNMERTRMIELIQFVVSEKELSDYGSITKETANYYLNKFNNK